MNLLPVISFRPEGREKFMALMMLMVEVKVEVTYLAPAHSAQPNWEVRTVRGEISYVDDEIMVLEPYGLPKNYHKGHYRPHTIEWSHIKMLEVIGP